MTLAITLFLVLLSSPAWAEGAAGGFSSLTNNMLVPLALSLPILYLLMIRPQQKQQKERQKMLGGIKKGDEVVTLAGIHGRVVGVTDQILTLEIADQVKVKIDREAVGKLKTQPK